MTGPISHDVRHVDENFSEWFRGYASYVCLDRAVPHLDDGLKPVQRRILHSLEEMDDGRFNKAANVVGHTMRYHPHGDASIGDALVNLGQKEYLVETQGNWGNPVTGDPAAATRYIECRLTKFAKDILFSPKLTVWAASYDGRCKEPVTLPAKFPLVLLQGVEGIAVGVATRILPHNFQELCDASIEALRGHPVNLVPDFASGGIADFTDYQGGQRGGRIRVRAKIEVTKKHLLTIREIPYGTTTTALIESILDANEKGTIKISKVIDNTAATVEIQVLLPADADPDTAIQALYRFTDCEMSLAPAAAVVHEKQIKFLSVNDILVMSAARTKDLLRQELEVRLAELKEKHLFSSLEKIFIENRIYRRIENVETWEEVIRTVDKGLAPFKDQFYRTIVEDDILKLLELKIKRISRYDSLKADEALRQTEKDIEETQDNLANLTRYAIRWFKELKKNYGAGRERRTVVEAEGFGRVKAAAVATANETLYVDRQDGFAGYGLRKNDPVEKCSRLDDIIVILPDGTLKVSRIAEKAFIGKNPLHIAVFRKEDNPAFTIVYRDGRDGKVLAKRFSISGVTRDKEYNLTRGEAGSRILWLEPYVEGKASERIFLHLDPECSARKKILECELAEMDVKGRDSVGLTLTKYKVQRVSTRLSASTDDSAVDRVAKQESLNI